MSTSSRNTDLPWFYPDQVSAEPGQQVHIHASVKANPCVLTVSRVGLTHTDVATYKSLEINHYEIPDNSDQNGCNWPVAFSFEIGSDWAPGYYDLLLEDGEGRKTHHFICVRRAADSEKAKAVIILSTNTYTAYNYWGGANAYANVEGLLAGEVSPEDSIQGAIGRLSRMRPYPQTLIAPPQGVARLINLEPRAIGQMAIPGDLEWMQKHQPSPYDGSACYLRKWENVFVEWLESHGYEIDYLTDHDFEAADTDKLDGYESVLIVGHSEYWSAHQKNALERFVDQGGKLAIFSGNTCYWKIRWEDEAKTMIAYKWRGHEDDPLWSDPATRKDATHLWSHEAFQAPEAELTGLSFLYGGYHRIAMCVARGSSGYTIYNDEHWALKDTDLYYGDQIGGSVPLIGYENDGCPIEFGDDGLPKPGKGVGIPSNLDIIAFAPATLAESERSPYPKIIPPEQPETLAKMAYGSNDPKSLQRLMRGHAVMASFTRGKGEVFNAGTTEWVHGLAAEDPFVEKITTNVLQRFGLNAG